jgi:hypothetical protein
MSAFMVARLHLCVALACVPLNDGNWWGVRRLCEFMTTTRLAAFGGLTGESLAHAIRRALHQLARQGVIEVRTEPTVNRLDALSARRPLPSKDVDDVRLLDD